MFNFFLVLLVDLFQLLALAFKKEKVCVVEMHQRT